MIHIYIYTHIYICIRNISARESTLGSNCWLNLPHAAAMLGNTAAVCARNYAWIDDEKLILDGQEKQVAAAEADQ